MCPIFKKKFDRVEVLHAKRREESGAGIGHMPNSRRSLTADDIPNYLPVKGNGAEIRKLSKPINYLLSIFLEVWGE